MKWSMVILVAVVLGLVVVVTAIWLEDRRSFGGRARVRPLRSRRRAVVATLQAATARMPGPTISLRPSEQGNFFQRVLDPAASAVARLARRISPPGYVDSVGRRLTICGQDRQVDSDRFLAGRLTTVAFIPVAFVAIELSPIPKLYRLLAFLLVTIALALGPDASLNKRARKRQEVIRKDLPALVDLLMISVEAGLGFDQALARAVSSVPGPLSEEFSRFLGEVRMGAERAQSLEALDARTDVAELRSFLMALIQAETFGVSIGSILKAQAQDIRVSQRQHVQELAQKAPVKMLFPLVFCVLPALFVVVIGPAAIEIYKTFLRIR
jgi:tight adherence protein C